MIRALICSAFLVCLTVLALDRFPVASVSSPEAEAIRAPAVPTPAPVPTLEQVAQIDPEEARVLEFLRGRHTGLSASEEENVARVVVQEARGHGLEIGMVLAVIQVESGGYHMAVSAVGALGLMQLLPTTAEEQAGKLGLDWRGPDSLFDPILNVKLGTAYLQTLYVKFGSVSTALAAYNWGPGAISRRLRKGKGVPKIYVDKVMLAYDTSTQRS